MALFDELLGKATDVAQVASKKVGEAYGATKMKMNIAEKQNALRTLYRELGEITYANAKSDEPDADEVEGKIMQIDELLEEIESLNAQYREMTNVVICASCGAKIDADANFCPKCGAGNKTIEE